MLGRLWRFGKGIDSVLTQERLNKIQTLVQTATAVVVLAHNVVALGQTLGIC